MTADEDRLLAEIRTNPLDDAPRAVYADLLTAHGDPRGEYIALALVRYASILDLEQARRYRELEANEVVWAAELGCTGVRTVWRRGFPEVFLGSDLELIAARDAIRRLPIYDLAVMQTTELSRLAALPELSLIRKLSLHGAIETENGRTVHRPIPRDGLAALCASPNTSGLRTLEFGDGALSEDGAALVGRAAWLPQLEALTIIEATLTGAAYEHLFARALPRLRKLSIMTTPIGPQGAQAIARCELPALRELALGKPLPHGARANLGDGAAAILGSRNLATVTELTIYDEDLSGRLAALAHSPHTRALCSLQLPECRLGPADGLALAGGQFPALVSLELRSNSIDDTAAIALARSPGLPRLVDLDLTYNRLTRDGVMAFVTGLPSLGKLGVWGNPMPSGVTREPYDADEAYQGDAISIPYSTEEVRAWFGDRKIIIH